MTDSELDETTIGEGNERSTDADEREQVSAAEQGGSNMWLPHIRSLSAIVLKRHEMFGSKERHPWIRFYVMVIDAFATLSSCSNGEFIDMLVQHDLLPYRGNALAPLAIGSARHLYPEEEPVFEPVQRFNVRILVLATQLGQLAQGLRKEAEQRSRKDGPGAVPTPPQEQGRRHRVAELRNALTSMWRTEMPSVIRERRLDGASELPLRVENIYHHVSNPGT